MVAWVGYEPAIQVLTHDADLVAVLINVRTVFAVIRPLVLQPAEALHIDHVAGLEICGRLRGVGSGAGSGSGVGCTSGAASASTASGFGSLIGSWGDSDCEVSSFSFSVGGSLSASNLTPVAGGSGAVTAGAGVGMGVSSTVAACGHTAAHRVRQVAIMTAVISLFMFLPPSCMRNERLISLPFGKAPDARFRSDSVLRKAAMPTQIRR